MWGIYTRTVPRPMLSTWGMWAILGLILLIAYEQSGARMDTTLPAAWMGFINPVIILVLALFYSERTWSRLDTQCSIIFAITVASWYVFDSPIIGLLGGIVADMVSAIPQIRKNWVEPHEEDWRPWTMFCVGSAVNLLAIDEWSIGTWLYPVYMATGSAAIAIPVIMHRLGFYRTNLQKA